MSAASNSLKNGLQNCSQATTNLKCQSTKFPAVVLDHSAEVGRSGIKKGHEKVNVSGRSPAYLEEKEKKE